jgi:hypothetical protein
MSSISRHYIDDDVRDLTKQQLINLVSSEPSLVPKHFNRSKINKTQLKDLLLAPGSPFRTTASAPTAGSGGSAEPPALPSHPAIQPSGTFNLDPSLSSQPVPSTVGTPTRQIDLRLYIQDDRFQQGIQHRTSKTVNVEGAFEETEDGVKSVRLNTHDIIRQLQSGYGAISGTGMTKIGFRDPEMPDYTEFFIKSEPFELSDIPTNPATVAISAEPNKYHLELRIDFDRHNTKSGNDPTNEILESPSTSSNQISTAQPENKEEERLELIEWLRGQARKQYGYENFIKAKHHTQQNQNVAQSWKFAASFSETYYKQTHPFPLTNNKIKTGDLYEALGVKETWLSQAREATRILRVFGEDGTHPAEDVITEVSRDRDPPLGSVRLFNFLKAWDRDHAGRSW